MQPYVLSCPCRFVKKQDDRGAEEPDFYDKAGVNHLSLSGPAADTDLSDRTRDPECVLRDFRPDPLAQKGKGDRV